ncbi:MAG: sigma-70 family RNA polymerase sigma factor [Bryobacteraceae bacterium]
METSTRTLCVEARTLSPEQEALVLAHMSLVPGIARMLVKRFSLPHWIDVEEMESCGYVGLCKAALNFDPIRSNFGTYAHLLVKGAMIDDYLRKQPPTAPISGMLNAPDGKKAWHVWDEPRADKRANYGEDPADPSPSAEDVLIEQGEQRRKCRHLSFASVRVSEVEFRCATKKHMNGKTLREIGAAEGRSASWAHYRVHCGERQLREALLATCAE